MSEMIGDRYKTGEILGKGGMGTVFRAQDTRLGRDVALKVINTNQADNGDSAKMLHREAQAIAQLHHPNIVTIYDYSGPEESPIYIAMELIEGQTLSQIMKQTKTLPDTVIMSVLYAVSSALAHAHEHKMIHRDIKPSNIMIERNGRVLLMDFGIAKSMEGPGAGHTQMRGTPNFMAPEQILEQGIGTYTDIFAVGTLIYTCALGVPPFMSPNTVDTMRKIATLSYKRLREAKADASSVLDRLSAQCMQKEPEKRPSAMDINKACRIYLRQKNILNPAHHLALYMAKLLGLPAVAVEAPGAADLLENEEPQNNEATLVSPRSQAPVPAPAPLPQEPTNSTVESVPAHLRVVRKSTAKLAEEQAAALAAQKGKKASFFANFFYSFIFLLFIAVIALGLVYAINGSLPFTNSTETTDVLLTDGENQPLEQKVTVRIKPNGMLYVNEMEYGFVKGSRDVMLAPGWYTLEARQRGLEPQKQEIKVIKGQDMTVIFDLTQIR